jgi:hypothetical protein
VKKLMHLNCEEFRDKIDSNSSKSMHVWMSLAASFNAW